MPVTLKTESLVVRTEIKPGDAAMHVQSQSIVLVRAVDKEKGTFEGFDPSTMKHGKEWPLSEFVHYVGPLHFECT